MGLLGECFFCLGSGDAAMVPPTERGGGEGGRRGEGGGRRETESQQRGATVHEGNTLLDEDQTPTHYAIRKTDVNGWTLALNNRHICPY